MNKTMKPGYQGKYDPARAMAERLMNHPGTAKDVYPSKSCADDEKMRLYKKGGSVKKSEAPANKTHKRDCQKFAMGGVAKIRHGEATKQGLPKEFKKISTKNFL